MHFYGSCPFQPVGAAAGDLILSGLMYDPPDSDRRPHRKRPSLERAPRLQVAAPVAFRLVSEDAWCKGSTLDISRSGVLFVPAEGPPPDSGDLLMVVFLSRAPHRADGTAPPMTDLYCGGRVARVTETAMGQPALAVQIEFEWTAKPPDAPWGPIYD